MEEWKNLVQGMMEPTQLLFYLLSPLMLLLYLLPLLRKGGKLPLPPGPRGLPIIGNMLMMDQLTHRGLAKLAEKYGGLVHLRLGSLHAFAVSTPDMAQQVLQAQDQSFSNRPAGIAIRYLTYDRADMVFADYGSFWRQMRKLCVMRLFSRRRAESWASVRDEVDSTVRGLAAYSGRPVDLGEAVSNLTKNIIFRAAFGSTLHEGQDELIAILQEFSRLFGAFNVGDFVPWLGWLDLQGMVSRLKAARHAMDRFVDRIIDDHIANPEPWNTDDSDMVHDLLAFMGDSGGIRRGAAINAAEDDQQQGSILLTKDNIKAIIMDVMFGGTETVASAIEWAMAELMKNPEDLKKVQQELADVVGLDRKVQETDLDKLPYFRCCIKETLRLHPPVPLLLHETAEDCEVAGYSVPAKSRVMINVWAIGRDKLAWEDAGAFRPGRFANDGEASGLDFRGGFFEFLPFGSGRRSCPGMQLGLYGLEMAVSQLLHCYTWELPDEMKPSELDMNDAFGLTAPKAVRLVVVPKPRLNC